VAAPPTGPPVSGETAASAPLSGADAAAAAGAAPAAAPTGGIVNDSTFASARDARDAQCGPRARVRGPHQRQLLHGSDSESAREDLTPGELRHVTQVFGFVKHQSVNHATDARHDDLHSVGLAMFDLLGQLH